MSITAERKTTLIKDNARVDGDTGSPEVQVAILTERINNLTEHFKTPREGQSLAPRPADDGQQAPLAARLSEEEGRASVTPTSSRSSAFASKVPTARLLAGRFISGACTWRRPVPASALGPFGERMTAIRPDIHRSRDKAPHRAGRHARTEAPAASGRRGEGNHMFDTKNVEHRVGRQDADPRNRPRRPSGRRRGARDARRDRGAVRGHRRQVGEGRAGLLPAHRPLPGKVSSPPAASPAASSSASAARPRRRR